jgi:hypothetical protein
METRRMARMRILIKVGLVLSVNLRRENFNIQSKYNAEVEYKNLLQSPVFLLLFGLSFIEINPIMDFVFIRVS